MKSNLCCVLNPYVICIACLAPVCGTCAGNATDWTPLHEKHIKGCRGLWCPTYHEAVTDPEMREKYLGILGVLESHES